MRPRPPVALRRARTNATPSRRCSRLGGVVSRVGSCSCSIPCCLYTSIRKPKRHIKRTLRLLFRHETSQKKHSPGSKPSQNLPPPARATLPSCSPRNVPRAPKGSAPGRGFNDQWSLPLRIWTIATDYWVLGHKGQRLNRAGKLYKP